MRRVDCELITVLEFSAEVAKQHAGVHLPGAIHDVLARSGPRELAHVLDSTWSRAKAQFTERPVDVGTTCEPDLWSEVAIDRQELRARAVPIGAVLESALIALIVASNAGRRGARPIRTKAHVFKERECSVDAVCLV